MNALDLQQNMPAKCSGNFHGHVGKDGERNPGIMRVQERLAHLRTFVRVVINPNQQDHRDRELEKREEKFLHSPKCSFQISTERRISPTFLRGLISQTNTQSGDRSGTSLSRSTSPENGG